MTKRRILITTPWLRQGCEIQESLESAGFEVSYAPSLGAANSLSELDAIIAGTEPMPAELLNAATRLKVIVRTGVGYDNIDPDHATSLGIALSTTPGSNRLSVAELVIGLIFDCARQISHNVAAVRGGRWNQDSGTEVSGAVLGIIGLGSIGKAVAQLARGLGMTVIATDPFPDEAFAQALDIEYLPLEVLLRRSDFVSLHIMLSEENRNLIDAERLTLMKPTAYLINTSRGGVVDERALADALRSGRLAGAALDVLEHEPLNHDSELHLIDNLTITAHIAGATVQSRERSARSAAAQIIGFFAGEEPEGLVNPEYRLSRGALPTEGVR